MRLVFVIASITFVATLFSFASGSTINIPADQSTIQAGIGAASKGDTVLVAPGTYRENIDFLGKAIRVKSSGGAHNTIIDGGNIAPVVTFKSNEGRASVLKGFTIQNGTSTPDSQYSGGGIHIDHSSPSILSNIIQRNTACAEGGGISVSFGSPLIKNNLIAANHQSACSGGSGGGIAIFGPGMASVIGNRIENNSGGWGGGMSLNGASAPTITNNIIRNNWAGQGGGMYIVNYSAPLIVQNLFYGNTGSQGGAIYWLVPSGSAGTVLVNNTIIGGSGGTQGSAVWVGGFDSQVQFFNNLLIGVASQSAVYCDNTYSSQAPTFTNNDAFTVNGGGLAGTCADQGTQNGNISVDPLFVGKGNYKLSANSPAIDAGDNAAPYVPNKDLAKKTRIVGAAVDMGAYEFQ
jgi:hypothetical protein